MSKIVGGTDGDISVTGFNVDLDSWSMNIETSVATDRTFVSEWEDQDITSFRARGSFSGSIRSGEASTDYIPTESAGGIDPTSFKDISATLTSTTGENFSGTIHITGFRTTRDTGSYQKGNYDFVFTGQPSHTHASS